MQRGLELAFAGECTNWAPAEVLVCPPSRFCCLTILIYILLYLRIIRNQFQSNHYDLNHRYPHATLMLRSTTEKINRVLKLKKECGTGLFTALSAVWKHATVLCDLQTWLIRLLFLLFCKPHTQTSGHITSDTLLIDYQFTFSLSQEDDRYYTAINFVATPEEVRLWL